jgi:hypothetical protein
VLDPCKWSVTKQDSSAEFTQELADPASGYAYTYHKPVRLEKAKPELIIEHSLPNTGKRSIQSSVYNHNFIVMDRHAPGPGLIFRVPFGIYRRDLRTPERCRKHCTASCFHDCGQFLRTPTKAAAFLLHLVKTQLLSKLTASDHASPG